MRHRQHLSKTIALITCALLLAACATNTAAPPVPTSSSAPVTNSTPAATPSGQATFKPGVPAFEAPSASPTPTRLVMNFDGLPLGSLPTDFVDVATEAALPAWVYQGNWRITQDEQGNQVFLHDDVRVQPAVSFQRYRGNALGKPNGELPDVYYSEVAMRPIRSPHNYTPTGDQGVQFYYLAYNKYLEVIVKPDQLEIWECNGGEPNTSKGWKRVWGKALVTKGGDVRNIGALVDTKAGTFTAYLDGKPLHTAPSTLLKPQPAWLAIRGIGNVVSFDNLVIEPR